MFLDPTWRPPRWNDCFPEKVHGAVAKFLVGDKLDPLPSSFTGCQQNVMLANIIGLGKAQLIQGKIANIVSDLRAGKVVSIELQLEGGGDHAFCVVPTMQQGGEYTGNARVIQSYQDRFLLQGGDEYPQRQRYFVNDVFPTKAIEGGDQNAYVEVFGKRMPFVKARVSNMLSAQEYCPRAPMVLRPAMNPALQKLEQDILKRAALAEAEFAQRQGQLLGVSGEQVAKSAACGALPGLTFTLAYEIIEATCGDKKSWHESAENVFVATAKGAIGAAGARVGAALIFARSAEVAGGLGAEAAAYSASAAGAGAAALAVAAADSL